MARKRKDPTWPAQKGVEMEPRPWAFTPLQAAQKLQVDRSTIYQMCKRGELPHIKCGDTFRIGSDAVWAMLNGRNNWPEAWEEWPAREPNKERGA